MSAPIPLLCKPGIQRDGTDFDGDASPDGQWVRWDARGRPRKMLGYRYITDRLAQISRGLGLFSRAGLNYLHTGGQNSLDQVIYGPTGLFNSITSRLPTAGFSSNAANMWQFDTVFDPIINNNAMVLAHCGQNLTAIDNNVETPIFWGPMDGNAALTPVGMPVGRTATTILVTTGNTATSTTISALASTAGLAYGMLVSGSGVPAAAYITAISGATITISAATSSTLVGTTLTFTTGGVSGGLVVLHPYVMALSSDGAVQWTAPLAKSGLAGSGIDFWSTGSGGAYITDQKLVRGMMMRGGQGYSPSGLLWSLNALVRASFNGGSTVFSFDTISDTITVMSSKGMTEMDGIYYWAGVDRFYMFSGTVREVPNTMDSDFFFENLNFTQRQKVFAFRVPRFGEIWWCFPLGTATECNWAVIYNTRLGCWYDTPLPDNGRSAAESAGVFQYPVMASVDTDSVSGLYPLWQHEIGVDRVARDTRPIRSYWETNNFTLLTGDKPQDSAMRTARIEPDAVQSGPLLITLKGRANAKAGAVSSQTISVPEVPSVPEQQVVPLNETRRLMYVRFESNSIGGDYRMGKSLMFIDAADGSNIGALADATEPPP